MAAIVSSNGVSYANPFRDGIGFTTELGREGDEPQRSLYEISDVDGVRVYQSVPLADADTAMLRRSPSLKKKLLERVRRSSLEQAVHWLRSKIAPTARKREPRHSLVRRSARGRQRRQGPPARRSDRAPAAGSADGDGDGAPHVAPATTGRRPSCRSERAQTKGETANTPEVAHESTKSRALTAAHLEPGRIYVLAEVAPMLGLEPTTLQARLRRAQARTGARVVDVTPWISAFRLCNGREWRFCAREPGSSSDDEGD
jgi:hypothetical protein